MKFPKKASKKASKEDYHNGDYDEEDYEKEDYEKEDYDEEAFLPSDGRGSAYTRSKQDPRRRPPLGPIYGVELQLGLLLSVPYLVVILALGKLGEVILLLSIVGLVGFIIVGNLLGITLEKGGWTLGMLPVLMLLLWGWGVDNGCVLISWIVIVAIIIWTCLSFCRFGLFPMARKVFC